LNKSDTTIGFVSPTPWSEERPRALVVCCSDGRLHAQVEEYLRAGGLDRADLYAVPGGPAGFDVWSSSVAENWSLDQSMRLLVEHHALEAIWLIAHEGCAYYRLRNAMRSASEIAALQKRDLVIARSKVLDRYPHLAVTSVYASVSEGRVRFMPLGGEPTAAAASPNPTPAPQRRARKK
jgi:hypothetical protein